MKTKIVVNGSEGKMGSVLVQVAKKDPGIDVVGCDIANGTSGIVPFEETLKKAVANCDVVVDFSTPSAMSNLLARCVVTETPAVIGTTGHTSEQLEEININARHIAIVKATNFSLGVNVLFWLTRKAAEILGQGFDLEIVETHHRYKKDAPSGTAKTLFQILAGVRDQKFSEMPRPPANSYAVYDRGSQVGERDCSQIGIHSVRGGTVFGKHQVMFLGSGEEIVLSHEAGSRECFAKGALLAAKWVASDSYGAVRAPDLYNMMDVLNL
ncbi:4-hydroxy-tetrahydrodipicolinate reductase [Patescibacteria group bacterium]|nr:4-hydroxy-tetrahydrodipicolinate reductase [Patescibacteria group bacterium]